MRLAGDEAPAGGEMGLKAGRSCESPAREPVAFFWRFEGVHCRPPVSALNRLDLPAEGLPTWPRGRVLKVSESFVDFELSTVDM